MKNSSRVSRIAIVRDLLSHVDYPRRIKLQVLGVVHSELPG
ncbi:hypothetical protein HMPREF9004_1461 [Schaalia cardiffensis F0333]|uniref:Uncharacterized protein n=1 Tax=Schaalia cardiffensis F0333 TaxID=888050 RepID=N6X178_9ACTO|nr:hypothetical protein HMPREF9004_1461 [Schaalia cardiffensis F0333]